MFGGVYFMIRKKIRCIATDMDGTLLNSRMEISAFNREAIQTARKNGIEVVVVTGRSYGEAAHLLAKSHISCPIISMNGAEIRNENNDVIHAVQIDKKKAVEIATILREVDLYKEMYTNDGIFTEDYKDGMEILVDIYHANKPHLEKSDIRHLTKKRLTDGLIHEIESYDDIFADNKQQIYKFLAYARHNDLLLDIQKKLKDIHGIVITSSARNNIEVTNEFAQKGIALEEFLTLKGIDLDETMGIGDNYNDLSMLENVGRAVAMGNAHPDIKEACQFVTATNDEDGVGLAIQEVLQQG